MPHGTFPTSCSTLPSCLCIFFFLPLEFFVFCVVSLLFFCVVSVIYIYISNFFEKKNALLTPLTLQYSIYSTDIYVNFTDSGLCSTFPKPLFKENKKVVNLILPKTSNNYFTFRNLVKSVHFKGSQFKLWLISILTS